MADRTSLSDVQDRSRAFVCAACGAQLKDDEAALDHAGELGHNVLPASAVPGLVPREVAERLAEALEEIRDVCDPDDPISTTAAFALGPYRAVFPKAEEA